MSLPQLALNSIKGTMNAKQGFNIYLAGFSLALVPLVSVSPCFPFGIKMFSLCTACHQCLTFFYSGL